jgi:dipeptidyl aminopeptidase/acylaminoacyl peptidase
LTRCFFDALKRFIIPLIFAGSVLPTVGSSSKRLVTVADCVRTRRLYRGQVELSPDGSMVAYVVKAPNVDANRNQFLLYLKPLRLSERRSNGRLLYRSDWPLDGLKWTEHPTKLVLLEQRGSLGEILSMDWRFGRRQVVARAPGMEAFAVDRDGQEFVFSAQANPKSPQEVRLRNYGYPIVFGEGLTPEESRETFSVLSLVKKARGKRFETSRVPQPWTRDHSRRTSFSNIQALSLSPNGRYLVFNFQNHRIPQSWLNNPFVKMCSKMEAEPQQLGMIDLHTEEFSIAFDSPSAGFGLPAVWAADSDAFSIVALSPPGSPWEESDEESGFRHGLQFEHYTHLFCVDTRSHTISQVLASPASWYQNSTLYWSRSRGEMLVQNSSHTYAWFSPGVPDWHEDRQSNRALGRLELGSGVMLSRINAASDGKKVVGVLENSVTPPDLFVQDLDNQSVRVITDVNPEYRGIKLGAVENIEWIDELGYPCKGYLIKPVEFEPGKKYPLVIMVKGWGDFFLADTHFQTAFPPQPLAAAGFLVLMANVLSLDQIPEGYPGKMGEAYQFISMVKSAVEALDRRRLVDKSNVGIIGFSSTSWQTDFMITHSDFPFAAVSSADSGIRNYGSYWMLNSKKSMNDYEDVLGGPPYGLTLENTLRFAPAFNAQNVKSPVLMEYSSFPGDLTGNMEFFVALKRQGKAVDMFYYPNGEHVLDTPGERIASLQRNVDWFRFWMQGFENAAPPYDPEQYVRWESLRHEQLENRKQH